MTYVEGFYSRTCKHCGIEYFQDKGPPHFATHHPDICDERPPEPQPTEESEMSITEAQLEALRTVHEMATNFLNDIITGVEEGYYEKEDNEDIDEMDDAIDVIGKLIDEALARNLIQGIESGAVKLVGSQE